MDIVLVPVGEGDPVVLGRLRDDLGGILQKAVRIRKGLDEPGYAFNAKRNQFRSSAILEVLLKQSEFLHSERVLGVVDRDLYFPELNFVFGEASYRGAVNLTGAVEGNLLRPSRKPKPLSKKDIDESGPRTGPYVRPGSLPECLLCHVFLEPSRRHGPEGTRVLSGMSVAI